MNLSAEFLRPTMSVAMPILIVVFSAACRGRDTTQNAPTNNPATIPGGKFWRYTPMLNWYLSDNIRLEFAYGIGRLNRFGLIGFTQFFQSRIQLQL
jgi:hypothetical protein